MTDKRVVAPDAGQIKMLTLTVLLVVLAVLGQTGSSAYGAYQDRKALQLGVASQQDAFNSSRKIRRQLNGIAGKTMQLAQQGNQNASGIIEKMQAAGVNFSAAAE